MNCSKCNQPIPQARIDALNGNCNTCVSCSSSAKVDGYMEYNHKTAGHIVICSQEEADHVRKISRRSGQGPMQGVKGPRTSVLAANR